MMRTQPTSLQSRWRHAALLAAATSFIVCSGCMLPPLDELNSDTGMSSHDAASGAEAASGADAAAFADTDTEPSAPDVSTAEPSDEFRAVAQMLRSHCSTCHGPNPMQAEDNYFSMAGGFDSTEREIWQAIYDVDSSQGKPLVAPGVPADSVLLERLSRDRTQSGVMPPGGWSAQHFDDADSLEEADAHAEKLIGQVRIWIANGAEFEGPTR